MTTRKFAFAAFAVAATVVASLVSGGAQARGPVDVQWQVTIGSSSGGYLAHGPVYQPAPVYYEPAPVYQRAPVYQPAPVYYEPASVYRRAPVYQPAPVYFPAPVVVLPGREYRYGPMYRAPKHWDVDGDGIPNRHDRVYNPRWDRDGDGVPNRHDRDNRRGRGHGDRYDDHNDRGGRDWREDRHR